MTALAVVTMLLSPRYAGAALCVGDCNGDGEVTVDELVTGVDVALGTATMRQCRTVNDSGSDRVTVDELVRAVDAAINGCPATVDVFRAPAGTDVSGPLSASQGVLPNGRKVDAAGTQVSVDTFPLNLALSHDESQLIVTNDGFGDDDFERKIQVIDTATESVTTRVPLEHYLGFAMSPDGQRVFVSNGKADQIDGLHFDNGQLVADAEPVAMLPEGTYPTGLSVSPDGNYLYVVGLLSNSFTTIDLRTEGTCTPEPPGPSPACQFRANHIGNFPYTVIPSADGQHAFVSSWGLNNNNPTGLIPAPLPPLDPNLPAMSSVAVVNLADPTKPAYQKYVPIGRSQSIDNKTVFGGSHPSAMKLSPDGALLYVTATNLDLLEVIDTTTLTVVAEVSLNQFESGHGSLALQGLYPEAVAVSPDGRRIYVADAGINAVQVIDADPQTKTFATAGFIPTGWYPSALALTADGKRLYVANAKGVGVGPNGAELVDISTTSMSGTPYYIGRIIKGSVSIIDDVDQYDVSAGTAAVRANNGFDPVPLRWVDADPGPGDIQRRQPVPADFGSGPSAQIKHVVFILKENRTYDQVFGDLEGGNGDSNLTLFGEDITPNHHALARQFAFGDNFYNDGEVSIPGHEWTDQGNTNDWIEKTWPFNYNNGGISDAIAQTGQEGFTKGGYIFELLDREKVPYRVYGEAFALLSRLATGIDGGGVASLFPLLVQAAGSVSELAAHTGDIFEGNLDALRQAGIDVDILTQQVWPNFKLDYPSNIIASKKDVDDRALPFIDELNQYEANGNLPTFLFIWLPNDHTFGAAPSMPTPDAAVADNDQALGMVVDALSHSPFWKDMAIFVSEDDAQDAQDHVSAHRTISLVMSPYVKHGYVSHEHQSNVSMLKTMELLLGVGPLSQYDRYAPDMRDYFTATPDMTPFVAVGSSVQSENNPTVKQAGNSYLRQAAEISAGLDFDTYDEAGPQLSRVLWLVHVGHQFERQKRLAVGLTLALTLSLIGGGVMMQRRRLSPSRA